MSKELPYEVALFRKLQGTGQSYFITVSDKLLPDVDSFTVTVVNPKTWTKELKYEHLAKKRGRAKIHESLKLTINKEVVEELGLSKGGLVWVRILPFTEKPPPLKIPYIARPVKVHTDKSSYFFTIAKKQVDYIRETGVVTGSNLHVNVTTPSGKTVEYIKRPVLITRDMLYKVILPMKLFQGVVQPGDKVHVKITLTDKPEEFEEKEEK